VLSRGDGPEGGGDGDETTMEVHEQAWIRFGPVDAGALYGLDGGLEMEAPELSRIMCRREVGSTAVDEGSVPRVQPCGKGRRGQVRGIGLEGLRARRVRGLPSVTQTVARHGEQPPVRVCGYAAVRPGAQSPRASSAAAMSPVIALRRARSRP